jgi:hypothetical protein
MIAGLRSGHLSDERRGHAREEILLYKRRCALMNYAFQLGLVSAIVLLLSLIVAEIHEFFRGASVLAYASSGFMLVGFLLVIAATGFVFVESNISKRQVEEELLDVSDLVDAVEVRQPNSKHPLGWR